MVMDLNQGDEKRTFYKDSMEQLWEYLKVLDMLLKIELIRFQGDEDNDFEQYKGLVIRYQEVWGCLDKDRNSDDEIPQISHLREQITSLEESIRGKAAASKERKIDLALERLCHAFELDSFEKYALLLCVAVELDTKYEKVFGFLLDDITMKRPTVGLACRVVSMEEGKNQKWRKLFAEGSTLNEFFLAKDNSNPKPSFLSREMKLDQKILDILFESNEVEDRIGSYSSLTHTDPKLEPLLLNEGIQQKIIRCVEHGFSDEGLIFNLWGHEGAGRTFQVRHICRYLERPLLKVDAWAFSEDMDMKGIVIDIVRETVASRAVLCIKDLDILVDRENSDEKHGKSTKLVRLIHELLKWVRRKGLMVFMLSENLLNFQANEIKRAIIPINIEMPDVGERKLLWESFAKEHVFDRQVDWGSMSSKFRFTPGQIREVLLYASKMAAWNCVENKGCIKVHELNKACYAIGNSKMSSKAVSVNPAYCWEDVVLPPPAKEQLKNACNQMKYRHIVYGEWGFNRKLSYGKGLSILLSGPPGTGKTMSAQVIAKELELELYKIDISQLVSKYIGETEKNMQEVFFWAQMSNAILFFDEADALFGKRSEVKDSHDRYSNIETAYLLQKIEEYEGVSILATNYIKNIDEAFMRRFNFIVEFPFPDAGLRECIWRTVFPAATPVDPEVDFELIAERFEISGGSIKNIALAAAFLAAEGGETVQMKHIVRAARDEINKAGKIFYSVDLEEYLDEK